MTEQTPLPENTAAAGMLEKILNNRVLADGTLLSTTASVGVGLEDFIGNSESSGQKEVMQITLKGAQVNAMPAYVRDAALKALAEIPALKGKVQFESDVEHAQGLKAKLEEFIARGADLPKNYLEWPGFNPELAGRWSANDHALQINKVDAGIMIVLNVAKTDQDDKNSQSIHEIVRTNIEGRMDGIRKTLLARLTKYTPNMDDAAKAKLEEDVNNLQIKVSGSDFARGTNVSIVIQSPKQFEQSPSLDLDKPISNPELAKTNPLNGISKEQLGKALGRAFLHAGETANEVFPKIAGREDMKIAVIKSLTRLKTAKPELAEELTKFMNDDAFKDHDNWSKPNSEKVDLTPHAVVNKSPAKDEMTIIFSLASGQALEVIKQIAGMGVAQSPSPQAAADEAVANAVIQAAVAAPASWAARAQETLDRMNTPAAGRAAG